MTSNTSSSVLVSKDIFDGLMAVRASGKTNMFDAAAVARIAKKFGFPDAAAFVKTNRTDYSRGIFYGFGVAE